MLKRKKTMPSGKPGHGSKRPTDAQPQNEILRSRGLGGNPQQAAPEAEWLSRGIACRFLCRNEKSQRGNRGLSQILCKHRNAVQIEQNLFKAEVAQAAAALFSK